MDDHILHIARLITDEASSDKLAYRVISGEPVGVTVGFSPLDNAIYQALDDSDEDLFSTEGPLALSMPVEVDPYFLISDDGGEFVYISDDMKNLKISSVRPLNEPGWPEWPEPDLHVWRTPAEFLKSF